MLGAPVLRLLRLLDPNLASNERLCRLLISVRGEAALLADPLIRGQLIELLRPDEARHLAGILGLTGGDPYAALRTMLVRRGAAREQALFDCFALTPPAPEVQAEAPALYHAPAALPLFHHQRIAARKVNAALANAPRRVLLHMPTGAGKTRTAMQIIAEHLRATEPALVIWLAYNDELCEQAAAEFTQTWHHQGNRELPVAFGLGALRRRAARWCTTQPRPAGP